MPITAKRGERGNQDEVVPGGGNSVQVVENGDPDEDQRANQGLRGETALLDLSKNEETSENR